MQMYQDLPVWSPAHRTPLCPWRECSHEKIFRFCKLQGYTRWGETKIFIWLRSLGCKRAPTKKHLKFTPHDLNFGSFSAAKTNMLLALLCLTPICLVKGKAYFRRPARHVLARDAQNTHCRLSKIEVFPMCLSALESVRGQNDTISQNKN